jgi:hypothetical protein
LVYCGAPRAIVSYFFHSATTSLTRNLTFSEDCSFSFVLIEPLFFILLTLFFIDTCLDLFTTAYRGIGLALLFVQLNRCPCRSDVPHSRALLPKLRCKRLDDTELWNALQQTFLDVAAGIDDLQHWDEVNGRVDSVALADWVDCAAFPPFQSRYSG